MQILTFSIFGFSILKAFFKQDFADGSSITYLVASRQVFAVFFMYTSRQEVNHKFYGNGWTYLENSKRTIKTFYFNFVRQLFILSK